MPEEANWGQSPGASEPSSEPDQPIDWGDSSGASEPETRPMPPPVRSGAYWTLSDKGW